MTCLSTTQYSLMINGAPTKLIQPKRGLRKGDPLSPILFTLCMEYFSRAMKAVGSHPDFQFHPRCRSLRLNHPCFADDLLMLCKGTPEVVQLMLDGFHCFSNTTCLQVNPNKSSLFCSGMNSQLQNHIIRLSGFNVGSISFTYLGVPISAKKLRGVECDLLIEKMVARIKIWSSKHISFAGRIQIVNSVLMNLICGLDHMLTIDRVLWLGTSSTTPKDRNRDQYTAPITASWAVKIVCKVKNIFIGKLQYSDWLTVNKYSIKGMYQNMCEAKPKTHWAKQVWNMYNVPRHRFTMWLASQDRLKTKARLVKVGIGVDSQCVWLGLCGHGSDLHITLCWLRRQVWDAMVPAALQTVKRVQLDTKGRIQQLIRKKVKSSDLDWFSAL
ncbi:uncharacterized protein [Spinacia oleracea]|uniref:Reverse transcriptase domain-containing protein n=1 Tax=Spinacia oleracea TaxID=3562 RepID=A0ABM3R7V8_SPIOL|nr:uncharacterized protein LOC110802991 [Spinacia oleracea]